MEKKKKVRKPDTRVRMSLEKYDDLIRMIAFQEQKIDELKELVDKKSIVIADYRIEVENRDRDITLLKTRLQAREAEITDLRRRLTKEKELAESAEEQLALLKSKRILGIRLFRR